MCLGGGGHAPKAPDPMQSILIQGIANQQAAAQQEQLAQQNALRDASLNHYNTSGPLGSTTWAYNGMVNGNPAYTQTTTLDPRLQGILNTNLSQIKHNLKQPLPDFTQSYNDAYKSTYNLGAAQLDPQYTRRQTDLQNQLANQGIFTGTDAYNRAMSEFSQERDTAYNQLRNQSLSDAGSEQARAQALALQLRDLPISELNSLMGNQPSGQGNPAPSNTPTPGIGAPDYQGAANQYYQGQLNAYNANQSSRNSTLSSLGSLAGAAGSAAAAFK